MGFCRQYETCRGKIKTKIKNSERTNGIAPESQTKIRRLWGISLNIPSFYLFYLNAVCSVRKCHFFILKFKYRLYSVRNFNLDKFSAFYPNRQFSADIHISAEISQFRYITRRYLYAFITRLKRLNARRLYIRVFRGADNRTGRSHEYLQAVSFYTYPKRYL